jgi:hypothetical protein
MARVARILIAGAMLICLGGWTQPQQLDRGPVRGIALAGDGSGLRVAAWTTETDVRVAVAKRGGAFGRVRTVASGLNEPKAIKVAVNPAGDAIIAWYSESDTGEQPATIRDPEPCCSRVRAALLRHGGRLTAPVVLSPAGTFGYDPWLAVGSGGRFGVLWSNAPGARAYARVGSFRRGFGRLAAVKFQGEIAGLTFDRRRARVQYGESGGALREVARLGRNRWSRATRLADNVSYPATVGFDGRGRQVAVWQSAGPSGNGARLGTRTPPGPLLERKLAGDSPDYGFNPLLSVSPSGAAVAAWIDGVDGSPAALVTMRRAHGPFRPTTVAYASAELYSINDVAVAPDGAAAIGMWTGAYSPGRESRVVLLGPGGAVLSADKVTPQLNAGPLEVEADSRGTVAAWGGFDGTSGNGLWVARAR